MESQQGEYLPVVGPTKDERTWAMLCHLCIVVQMFLPILVLGPLLILLIKGDDLPLVKQQGKEAINFQITLFLAALVCGLLIPLFGLGFLLAALVAIYAFIAGIIASVKVKEGEPYRYGICLRLLS
jgi:uncharacterized protein